MILQDGKTYRNASGTRIEIHRDPSGYFLDQFGQAYTDEGRFYTGLEAIEPPAWTRNLDIIMEDVCKQSP